MVDVFIITVSRKFYKGIQYFGANGATNYPGVQWITSYDDSLCPNARATHEYLFLKKLIVCQNIARVHKFIMICLYVTTYLSHLLLDGLGYTTN